MTDSLQLYLRYVVISVRSQLQYRASFLISALGHFGLTLSEFLGVWFLFQRFGNLNGWSVAEVALLYGMVNCGFALSEAVARGFDTFPSMVRGGEFDRLLLRPRSTALQIAGSEVQLMRVGRLLQGIVVLAWAMPGLEIAWTPARAALLLAAILGTACLFSGLFILQATAAFWTVEALELANTLTYGGTETAQYPLTIYQPWFRTFFMVVVPLACANYFPAHALLGRSDSLGSPPLLQWLSPLVGLAFLLISLQVWKVGVRHYRSTGS